MLPKHKDAFFEVATALNCWIGVREPNPLADKWIGIAGFAPKPETCKAKTADNPDFHFAGLVVDPTLCPAAFLKDSLAEAKNKWKKFADGKQLPKGYTRETTGNEKGLVKHHGAALHADFDLMSLSIAEGDGKMGYTNYLQQHNLFMKAQQLLNKRLGSPMIQHGPEMAWRDGVDAREREYVYYFGPKRAFRLAVSSMPQKAEAMH